MKYTWVLLPVLGIASVQSMAVNSAINTLEPEPKVHHGLCSLHSAKMDSACVLGNVVLVSGVWKMLQLASGRESETSVSRTAYDSVCALKLYSAWWNKIQAVKKVKSGAQPSRRVDAQSFMLSAWNESMQHLTTNAKAKTWRGDVMPSLAEVGYKKAVGDTKFAALSGLAKQEFEIRTGVKKLKPGESRMNAKHAVDIACNSKIKKAITGKYEKKSAIAKITDSVLYSAAGDVSGKLDDYKFWSEIVFKAGFDGTSYAQQIMGDVNQGFKSDTKTNPLLLKSLAYKHRELLDVRPNSPLIKHAIPSVEANGQRMFDVTKLNSHLNGFVSDGSLFPQNSQVRQYSQLISDMQFGVSQYMRKDGAKEYLVIDNKVEVLTEDQSSNILQEVTGNKPTKSELLKSAIAKTKSASVKIKEKGASLWRRYKDKQ